MKVNKYKNIFIFMQQLFFFVNIKINYLQLNYP